MCNVYEVTHQLLLVLNCILYFWELLSSLYCVLGLLSLTILIGNSPALMCLSLFRCKSLVVWHLPCYLMTLIHSFMVLISKHSLHLEMLRWKSPIIYTSTWDVQAFSFVQQVNSHPLWIYHLLQLYTCTTTGSIFVCNS